MSGARMSVPGTPVQQPQQNGVFFSGSPAVSGGAVGGLLNGVNAGTGFATSFEGLSSSSPATGGVVAQQGGQGFPPHGHQRSRSQQGAVSSQGAGQPQTPYNPGAGQLEHSAFFGGGITPQQTPAQQPQQQVYVCVFHVCCFVL